MTDLEAKLTAKLMACIEDVGMELSDDSPEMTAVFDRIAFEAVVRLLQMSSDHSMRLMIGKQAIDFRGGFIGTTLYKTPKHGVKKDEVTDAA
jgi:hypothetical protein